MALGQNGKELSLLENLKELNDLVKVITSDKMQPIMDSLQKKINESKICEVNAQSAVKKHEELIRKLDDASDKHDAASAEASKQASILAAATNEQNKTLANIQNAQAKIDIANRDMEKRASEVSETHKAKELDLSQREQKVADRQKNADAIRIEYEKKLSDLKKITG